MATTATIRSLAAELSSALREAYPSGANGDGPFSSAHPLREAFAAFGREAANVGISLEETMAAAADALQELFERVGGHTSDSATMLAAGIALAASSRSYQDGEILDLNDLLPADSGWWLSTAYGVNDAGQIVGSGCLFGRLRGSC